MKITWDEVKARYAALKPTSRAAKNLNEWGDVLSAAYTLDPAEASLMWQRIIDMNVSTDVAYAKYFVAQIFNKLTDRMDLSESVRFLLLDESRLPLLFMHGYEGGNNDFCLYTVIGYFIRNNDLDRVFDILGMEAQKREETDFSESAFVSVSFILILQRLCAKQEYAMVKAYPPISENVVFSIFDYCEEQFEGSVLSNYIKVYRALMKNEPILDDSQATELLEMLKESDKGQYFDFLFLERNVLSSELVDSLVEEYCEAQFPLPLEYDISPNIIEKRNWFRQYFEASPTIRRNVLFRPYGNFLGFIDEYLDDLARCGNWKEYVGLLAGVFSNAEEGYARNCASYLCQRINMSLPKDEGSSFFYSSSEQPNVFESFDDNQKGSFATALAQLCALANGTPHLDKFFDEAKKYVQAINGNLDILNQFGFDVRPDKRSKIKIVADYCRELISSRAPYDISYSDKTQKLHKLIREFSNEKKLYGSEEGYELSKHKVILEYFFLHEPHGFSTKADIILGCLLHGKTEQALSCLEMLIETTKYPNYTERNGWEMEFKNTINNLVRDVVTNQEASYSDDYPEAVINSVISIAQQSLPYLTPDSRQTVNQEILKLKADDNELAQYISNLLNDVNDYISETKPRGFGKRLNNVTSNIMHSVKTLSKANRVDVLVDILHKLCQGRNRLGGPQFSSGWIEMFSDLEGDQLTQLYNGSIEVFDTWLSEHPQARDILRVAERFGKTGNIQLFKRLKSQILQYVGYVDGLDDRFDHNSDTVKPIKLVTKRSYSISFVSFCYKYGGIKLKMYAENRTDASMTISIRTRKINGEPMTIEDRIAWVYETGEFDGHINCSELRDKRTEWCDSIEFSLIIDRDEKGIDESPVFRIRRNKQNTCFEAY